MADEQRNAGNAMFGLGEPQSRRAAPEASPAGAPGPQASPPPGSPQYVYVQAPPQPAPAPSSAGVKILPYVVALLFIVSAINLYITITGQRQINETTAKQADELNLLTRRMNSSDERYAQLSGRFQVTTEKLGLTEHELGRARALASNIQKQQEAAVQQLNQAIAQKASAEEVNKLQADTNTKLGGVAGDINGINKKLGETNDALSGAKGELSGAIARTHDELVTLAHKTDRDYFEFNLASKKSQQKVGTVTVALTRTNPKKNQFTVTLLFDDKPHPYKDRTVGEPLFFYLTGSPGNLELVVNKLSKESIAGYISTPKGLFSNTPNVLSARPGA